MSNDLGTLDPATLAEMDRLAAEWKQRQWEEDARTVALRALAKELVVALANLVNRGSREDFEAATAIVRKARKEGLL